MARISSIIGGIELQLLNDLADARAGVALTALQLSEEKRVVSPAFEPTTFVAIAGLESDLSAVQAATRNVTAADSLMTQTASLITQMQAQLEIIQDELETDVDQSLTPTERAAAQVKIDAAINQINTLAATAIEGRSILDGSSYYDVSGVNNSQVDSFRVFSKQDIGQSTAAKGAQFTYTGTDRTATADATITIKADGASQTLDITAGDTLESIAESINTQSSATGVSAAVDGNTLTIRSTETGSDHSMSLLVSSGSFAVTGESAATSTATSIARFTYQGSGGQITDDATFDVTGNLGTHSFSVAATDDLTTVADAINAEVLNTGVAASVSGDQLYLTSATAGGDQYVTVEATSGLFEVTSTASSATQAVTSGELTYTGVGGLIEFNATFDITGNLGTHTFNVLNTDTLSDVVDDINVETGTTGVYATLSGDDITLHSTGEGSDQFVNVDVTAGEFIVTAGNDVTGWGTTTDQTYGTTTTTTVGQTAVQGSVASISGYVDKSGTKATLDYAGSGGNVQAGDEGDLTVTGSVGTAVITIAAAQSLASVATAINNQSYKTGVTASVDGDTLTFESTQMGGAQSVSLSSTGTFLDNTTGGQGDGTAYGTDMVATINGFDYYGDSRAELRHRTSAGTLADDATIQITGNLGSASLSLTTGQTLAQVRDAINAETANTGIYASIDSNDIVLNSTTAGADATMQLNVTSGTFNLVDSFDQDATAAQLVYTGTGGDFNSYPVNFTLDGPDGSHVFNFLAGTSLSDASGLINAETGTTGVVAYASGDTLTFLTQDKGSAVTMSITGITVTGGDGSGNATGTDAIATSEGADGSAPMGWLQGNTIDVNQNGFHYQLDLAEGFSGDLTPISVRGDGLSFALLPDTRTTSIAIPSLLAANLGGATGKLTDLLSGGSASGLNNNTSEALRIVDEAIGDVTLAEAQVTGLRNSSIDTASTYLSEQQTNLEDAIAATDGFDQETIEAQQAYYETLVTSSISSLAILYSQRTAILDLLQQVAGVDTT